MNKIKLTKTAKELGFDNEFVAGDMLSVTINDVTISVPGTLIDSIPALVEAVRDVMTPPPSQPLTAFRTVK